MADMEKWEQDRLSDAQTKATTLHAALQGLLRAYDVGLTSDPEFDPVLIRGLADMAKGIEYDVRAIENGAPLTSELERYDTELLEGVVAGRKRMERELSGMGQAEKPESED